MIDSYKPPSLGGVVCREDHATFFIAQYLVGTKSGLIRSPGPEVRW